MKLPSEIHPVWIYFFWAMPFIVPALSLYREAFSSQTPMASGIEWLAFPAEMASRENSFSWECWVSVPEGSKEEVPVPAVAAGSGISLEASEQSVHPEVLLSGTISAGDELVYCFSDTESGRWFRLRPGEQDAVSGLSLKVEGSAVKLVSPSGLEVIPELADGLRERSLPYLTIAN